MPESQNIEWKSKWKDEYLEWICGYANAQGGKIYIGCDDEGNVIGVSNAHKLLEDIPNKVRDAMGIIVGVNLLTESGKDYIEIDVPTYPIGISCKGVYYYRSGSTKQVLTGPALEGFLMRKRGATWDNLPLPAFSLDSIIRGVDSILAGKLIIPSVNTRTNLIPISSCVFIPILSLVYNNFTVDYLMGFLLIVFIVKRRLALFKIFYPIAHMHRILSERMVYIVRVDFAELS